jgi:glycosyltransferase involved in cell wall biosynthesis
MESMASGLSIVVSPEASHNLDPDQPFIHIVDRDDDAQVARAVEQAVRENHRYRQSIRRYVEENFDWSVIGPRYIQAAEHIRAGSK